MPRWIEFFVCVPRFECVGYVRQTGDCQFGIIAQKHGFETGPVDPVQSFLGVSSLVIVVGEKTISLQSTGGIKNKNLKHGFTKAEAGGAVAFCQGADHEVKFFNVVVLATVNFL